MLDSVSHPRKLRRERVRGKQRLEAANEALAARDAAAGKDYLRWRHPTKGYRRMSHRRMRQGTLHNQIVQGLSAGLPFSLHVQLVARGKYRNKTSSKPSAFSTAKGGFAASDKQRTATGPQPSRERASTPD